ncbi:hypothetical protein RND81_12G133800 [Saponaria officinalis]|uniref:C2H2-type domain-containing protein n=1 Tax=Saponaria officinalis TaxID=3572 RepID=A0AAW1HA12_SAPOF
MSIFFAMAPDGQFPSDGQLYVALYFCRQCRFTSIDLEGITHHVNNHTLEASIRFQNPHPIAIAQYFCRRCQFTSIDLEGIIRHVNNHIQEASLRFQNPHPMVPTQQLRERNLYFNPYRQLLPSSTTHHSAFISGNDNIQMQQSTQHVETWRSPSQAQMVQEEQQFAETERDTEVPLMPLLDQLNQPSAAIIDLDSDQTDERNNVDLTLRL